jgi:hypothetical protein
MINIAERADGSAHAMGDWLVDHVTPSTVEYTGTMALAEAFSAWRLYSKTRSREKAVRAVATPHV